MVLITPLPHQIPILERLENDRKAGITKTLVVIPSGAGKTNIAAFDSFSTKAKSILYICHRREILRQAAETFKQIHGVSDDKIGFIDQSNKDFDKDIIFATNTTLFKSKNLKKLKKKIDYMIIDEFHHVAADSYQTILKQIFPKFSLGLTATPFRMDGKEIIKHVDYNISTQTDIEQGIIKGILVPFHYNALYDNIDYSDLKLEGHKYKQRDLDKKLLIDARDKRIIEKFNELIGKGNPTIGFCVSIKHCKRMVNRFNKKGISARMTTYLSTPEERQRNYDDFSNNKFDVLFTKDVYNEGVDFPNIQAVMFLRPTDSETTFWQQLGRGLRKKTGKTHVTVLDFVGNYHRAYKIREYLRFATLTDAPIKHDTSKPILEYNVPRYHIDHRLIDLFEYQKTKEFLYNPSEEMIIEDYNKICKLVGRHQIRITEYYKHPESKYSYWHIHHKFGNRKGFLEAIKKYMLIEDYNKIVKQIGHPISISRYMKQSNSKYRSRRLFLKFFGNFKSFYKTMDISKLRSRNRTCLNCGSSKTKINSKGYERWFKYKGEYLCQKCSSKLYRQSKKEIKEKCL